MQDFSVQKAQIYTEFEGLNDLKTQARTDEKGALREVAKQFEGLFLREMVKSMRKAGDVFAEGNYLNSKQSEFYREMFDSQLSLTLTQKQGTGLAEALVQQLSRQIPGMNPEGIPTAAHKDELKDYDRSVPVLSRNLPEQVSKVNAVAESISSETSATTPIPAPESAAMPERFDSPEEFVRHLLPLAERAAQSSGINPRVMVAQAALETGWGRHMIEGKTGSPSFNLFGIKADQRWSGESVDIATTEFREGVPMSERASFRAYPDYESSFRDYASFLESNPRYRDVLASANDPDQFALGLQEAGYATDPNYGEKIRRILNTDTMDTLSMGVGGAEE